MSGNGLLNIFARAMKDIFTERTGALYVATKRARVKRVHAEIAEAIIEGDAEVAEQLMRDHMSEYVKIASKRESQLMNEVVDWR